MIEVWLPFPPSVNNLFSQARNGRRFPSASYKRWRKEADAVVLQQRIKSFGCRPVWVRLVLTAPDKRTRDVDNYSKAPLDALVRMGIIDDDQQVMALTTEWLCVGPPGLRIQIADSIDDMPWSPLDTVSEPARKPPLSKTERQQLERWRRRGEFQTLKPFEAVPKYVRKLIDKGYIREHLALFGDTQALEVIE